MIEENTITVDKGLPQWGTYTRSSLGLLQHYDNAPHDDRFVLEHHSFVINLSYDETDISVDSDKLRRMCTPRDCIVTVPRGTEIREVSDGSADAIIFDIETDQYDMLLDSCINHKPSSLHFRDNLVDSRVGDIARVIRKAFFTGRQSDSLYMDCLLSELQQQTLASYFGQYPNTKNNKNRLTRPVLTRVHEYMDAYLDCSITIEKMASVAELSPYHFARTYKNTTRQSPYNALVERRLMRARKLLSIPTNDIVNVAFMTGFCSQSHMTDVFKNLLGVTPKQYRKFVCG